MKKDNKLGTGAPIALTVFFGILAIISFSDGGNLVWVPLVGVAIGVIMTIVAAVQASNASARKKQQESIAKTLTYDTTFGNGDLTMYFNSKEQEVTICATSTEGSTQKTVHGFVRNECVETDEHLVALDSLANKVVRVKNYSGFISLGECCINEELQKLGITIKSSSPSLKAINDYAFVTDDTNQFIAIVTPDNFYVHRYSDIVSIAYEENGNDVFNKALGGAVVGGLLFGGVGAIVGGNTAKATQNKEIKSMSIKVLLKSTSNPTIALKIYKAGPDGAVLETKKEIYRTQYEQLMKEVSDIKDIFSIILDIVDKNSVQQVAALNVNQNISVSDELMKLLQLKEAGVLTEDEFQAQKAKLLE